jgi:hypothetical protein
MQKIFFKVISEVSVKSIKISGNDIPRELQYLTTIYKKVGRID